MTIHTFSKRKKKEVFRWRRAIPPHRPELSKEDIQKWVVNWRAHIIASTHFGPLKRAVTNTLGTDLATLVRQRATEIQVSRSGGNILTTRRDQKPPTRYQFVNSDRKVALEYARNPAGALFNWAGFLYKKFDNIPAIKLGPTSDLNRSLEPTILEKIVVQNPSGWSQYDLGEWARCRTKESETLVAGEGSFLFLFLFSFACLLFSSFFFFFFFFKKPTKFERDQVFLTFLIPCKGILQGG